MPQRPEESFCNPIGITAPGSPRAMSLVGKPLADCFLASSTKSRIGSINGLGRNCQNGPLLGVKLACTIDEIMMQGLTGFLLIG